MLTEELALKVFEQAKNVSRLLYDGLEDDIDDRITWDIEIFHSSGFYSERRRFEGYSEFRVYDKNKNITLMKSSTGITTIYEYTDTGKVKEIQVDDGSYSNISTFEYNEKSNLVSSSVFSKYNNGEINMENKTEWIYDALDRVIKIVDNDFIDGETFITENTYEDDKLVYIKETPDNIETTVRYPTSTIEIKICSDGTKTTTIYNDNHKPINIKKEIDDGYYEESYYGYTNGLCTNTTNQVFINDQLDSSVRHRYVYDQDNNEIYENEIITRINRDDFILEKYKLYIDNKLCCIISHNSQCDENEFIVSVYEYDDNDDIVYIANLCSLTI